MKGIYVCFVKVPRRTEIQIGALGNVVFEKGLYLYVGSAMRGLENRTKRHKTSKKHKKHWHIDYLTSYFPAFKCLAIFNADKQMETELAQFLSNHYPFIENFGASDDKAPSHLFYIDEKIYKILKGFSTRWKEI